MSRSFRTSLCYVYVLREYVLSLQSVFIVYHFDNQFTVSCLRRLSLLFCLAWWCRGGDWILGKVKHAISLVPLVGIDTTLRALKLEALEDHKTA